MTEAEILDYMAGDEFADKCRELRIDLDAGYDVPLERMAERLGLPWRFFMLCTAAYTAHRTGEPVLILPHALEDRERAN